MPDQGFVKAWRDDADNPYLQNPDDFYVYYRLKMRACWDDQQVYVHKKKRVISLKRGQLWASTRDLAEQLKLHHSKIVRILKRLKIGTLIDTDTETGIHIITICKYDENQDCSLEAKHQAERQTTSARNSGETQNKEDKESREIIEKGGDAPAREPDAQAQPPPQIKFLIQEKKQTAMNR